MFADANDEAEPSSSFELVVELGLEDAVELLPLDAAAPVTDLGGFVDAPIDREPDLEEKKE